ncbi:MAG: transglycosylase SLT domain-containing protein [Bacteroidia bacterium]|nr:transglycosylase SLT domain-containing protein [Bacteroidia bacterium]
MSLIFLLNIFGIPPIPEHIVFCGVHATIEPEARQSIQQYVIKLHEHPPTLNAIVARAETLLPYIQEALHYIGVPEDLKYLAIQESRLNPYAVSRSGAVGYWQFKDFTAREVGLVINETVDERRHLFRSSAGAALYLAKQYFRHRNWLYAIIAYYEGGSGALPYIDSTYVGKNEICIRANTHWYLIRAIAHKLVFESLIKRQIYALYPVAYEGPTRQAWELAQQHGIRVEEFLGLNPWLLRPTLPTGRPWTYYVPVKGPLTEKPQEPLKALFSPIPISAAIASVPADFQYSAPTDSMQGGPAPASQPSPPISPPKGKGKVISPAYPASSQVALLPIVKEPYLHYHWEYPPPAYLSAKLRKWNPFYEKNSPVLIVPPRRAQIHIVQRGETLREVAQHYRRSLSKLISYNTLQNPDSALPIGLRVYLREPRPYDERPIQYKWN